MRITLTRATVGVRSHPGRNLSLVRLAAHSMHGEPLVVRGAGLSVVPVAEAEYVEEFPGSG